MKLITPSTALPLLSLLQVSQAQNPTNCNANNCLRQVRASAFPTRSTRQDCSAYQTPTAGVAATIPAYASSCANGAAYASACSCIGITTAKPATTLSTASTRTSSSTTSSSSGSVLPAPSVFGLVLSYNQLTTFGVNIGPYQNTLNPIFNPVYLSPQVDPVGVFRFTLSDGTKLRIAGPEPYASDQPYIQDETADIDSFFLSLTDMPPVEGAQQKQISCRVQGPVPELKCQYPGSGDGLFAACEFKEQDGAPVPPGRYVTFARDQMSIDRGTDLTCYNARLLLTA